MDSEDSSSDTNAPAGYEASSSDPSSKSNVPYVSSSDPSSESNVPYRGEPASSGPVTSSDPSAEANIPYAQQLERPTISSGGSSEDDRGPSGFTSDELIFKALETVYEDGTGLDIDEIFNFVEERFDILDDFREQLEDQLGDLLAEGQVQKLGNRYRIRPGQFDIPNPTQAISSGDSTNAKPQYTTPSTSSSSVPKLPDENPQMDAVVKELAEAEQLEREAQEAQDLADKHAQLLKFESHETLQLAVEMDAAVKELAEAEQLEREAQEAQDLADKHAQLLKFESHVTLQLAVEILNRCANGQKIFLR